MTKYANTRVSAGIMAIVLIASVVTSFSSCEIEIATLRGVVTNSQGNRLEGVSVEITTANGKKLEAVSSEQGAFMFPRIPPGIVGVKLSKSGYQDMVYEAEIAGGDEYLGMVLYKEDEVADITGVIVPPPDTVVSVEGLYLRLSYADKPYVGSARTDANGTFSFKNVPRGKAYLSCYKRGYCDLIFALSVDGDLSPTLELRPGIDPVRRYLSNKIVVEVLPQMELIAGVLNMTDAIRKIGLAPRGKGNEYYHRFKSYLKPHQEHKVVSVADDMMLNGFSYHVPPAVAINLTFGPRLKLTGTLPEHIAQRAGGQDALDRFILLADDFAAEVAFVDFFHQERAYLEQMVKSFEFDAQRIVEWMAAFYGETAAEFHVVLAPSQFPSGGFAAEAVSPDGERRIYAIFRAVGVRGREPQFGSMKHLEQLALHEWGHMFCNPAIDPYLENESFDLLFQPVKEIMERQAYGTIKAFLYEQVLRAIETVAAKELYGGEAYASHLKQQHDKGFYLTEYTVEQLVLYQKNRDRWPKFSDFAGYLIEKYLSDLDELILLAPK